MLILFISLRVWYALFNDMLHLAQLPVFQVGIDRAIDKLRHPVEAHLSQVQVSLESKAGISLNRVRVSCV